MKQFKKPTNTTPLQTKGYRTKASGGKKVIPRSAAVFLALVAFYIGLHAPSFSSRPAAPSSVETEAATEIETESES